MLAISASVIIPVLAWYYTIFKRNGHTLHLIAVPWWVALQNNTVYVQCFTVRCTHNIVRTIESNSFIMTRNVGVSVIKVIRRTANLKSQSANFTSTFDNTCRNGKLRNDGVLHNCGAIRLQYTVCMYIYGCPHFRSNRSMWAVNNWRYLIWVEWKVHSWS